MAIYPPELLNNAKKERKEERYTLQRDKNKKTGCPIRLFLINFIYLRKQNIKNIYHDSFRI